MRCPECGAETAETAESCVLCGAPAVVQPLVAADPSASRPNDDVATVPVTARDPWSPPAWTRRGQAYFWTALVLCLALYMAGLVAQNKTPPRSGIHPLFGWVIFFGLAGALLSLILIEVARNQFVRRQAGWTVVLLMSFGLLAFLPFLWLALIRRRARDWLVFAAYLAAVVAEIYFLHQYADTVYSSATVMVEGLCVVAFAHIVLAFSPAAGPATWREGRAARAAAKSQQPAGSAVPPEEWQQDAGSDHLKPIASDSGGPDAK